MKKRLSALLFCLTVSTFAADRPNILFCIADDWGWPHAGAYGAGEWIKTPSFDRIASEGVLFENCFTSNPKCCPCRASIVTGRNSWQLKECTNHMAEWPGEFVSYPDLFMKAGYHVGLTGKGWGPGSMAKSGRKHNPAGPSYEKFKEKPKYKGISSKDYARNFIEYFMAERPSKDTPFCFWLGTHEPHRGYQDGAGIKEGKKISDVDLPAFYPDTAVVRSDMLDYAVEVEHFDNHVGRVLDYLESTGELDNTIVVMTSDHGMPFPFVKGQINENGFHLPLAVRWGNVSTGNRKIRDFINVRDFAPTFLEAAGIPTHAQITGTSFVDLLKAKKSGVIEPSTRNTMLIGKERHDLGRPNDWGYPVRAIRTEEFLYVHNYEPDRWPAGNPETGYKNCDGSPTKSLLVDRQNKWYELSFGKRPAQQLFHIGKDPQCVNDLGSNPEYAALTEKLRKKMVTMLTAEGDPRQLGNAAFFDTIEYTGKKGHSWESVMGKKKK